MLHKSWSCLLQKVFPSCCGCEFLSLAFEPRNSTTAQIILHLALCVCNVDMVGAGMFGCSVRERLVEKEVLALEMFPFVLMLLRDFHLVWGFALGAL
eukprot:6414464-Amphidinium_carterae.1